MGTDRLLVWFCSACRCTEAGCTSVQDRIAVDAALSDDGNTLTGSFGPARYTLRLKRVGSR